MSLPPQPDAGSRFAGRVLDDSGEPVEGAFVSIIQGEPSHTLTVFSDATGAFIVPGLDTASDTTLRIRRFGYQDRREVRPENQRDWVISAERDRVALAAQLPANFWLARVLDRLDLPAEREEFLRQCTYCHQQGNRATRFSRDEEDWAKILELMGRRGALLHRDLREKLPAVLIEAYDAKTGAAEMADEIEAHAAALPSPEIASALIEEWSLGGRASMQHDLMVHPNGRVYSVDMEQDVLFELDPAAAGGARRAHPIPRGDVPLGGALADKTTHPATHNAHMGPHSLQVAPGGAIWITLALANQLARFDPVSFEWTFFPLESGFYPHTLRIDRRGRIWYTVSASNHLGMLDPASGVHRQIRLPTTSVGQALTMRAMPFLLWLGRQMDLRGIAARGDGADVPVPYGIDIAPDGSVWFSQLNAHRIGRVDPESFDVESIETPFKGPRRLRFDREGRLWIPGYSSNLIARFDPETRTFASFPLPIEPTGSDVPYALAIAPQSGDIWICGTNSDSLIRFEVPTSERPDGHFSVYPLPTRVSYTREIDFDARGRIWTSNSNSPAWQIEGGLPRVLRLDPRTTHSTH